MFPTKISISKEKANNTLAYAVILAFQELYKNDANAHIESETKAVEWAAMEAQLAVNGSTNDKMYIYDLSTENDPLDQDFEVSIEGEFYEFKIEPIH